MLDHTQAVASDDKEAPKPPEGFGTLPQEAVIRDIVTDRLTDDNAESLVCGNGREKLKKQLLLSIKRKTDVRSRKSCSPTSRCSKENRSRGPRYRRAAVRCPPVADGAIVDAEFAPDPPAAPDRPGRRAAGDADLARLHAVPVELAVEIGRTQMTIGDTLGLGPGSIITLNRMAGEPVDLWSTAARSPAARSW